MDSATVTPLGWKVRPWCRRVGISPATYYNLDADMRPPSVKLRECRLIIESPEAYLHRVAEAQREPEAA